MPPPYRQCSILFKKTVTYLGAQHRRQEFMGKLNLGKVHQKPRSFHVLEMEWVPKAFSLGFEVLSQTVESSGPQPCELYLLVPSNDFCATERAQQGSLQSVSVVI